MKFTFRLLGTLSLVVWMRVWSKSTNSTSFLSFSRRSVSALPNFFANSVETFNSGTEWIIGTDAFDDATTSICWRSAPQSAQRSLMIVVWRHSSISKSGELELGQKWTGKWNLVRIFKQGSNLKTAYFFVIESPSLCNSFFTNPQWIVFFRRWTFMSLSNRYKHRIEPLEICDPACTTHFNIVISLSGDKMCVVSLISGWVKLFFQF